MIRRIKYWLLTLLLNDICKRSGPFVSDCKKCTLGYEIEVDGFTGPACLKNDIFVQARKVWGLMPEMKIPKDLYDIKGESD